MDIASLEAEAMLTGKWTNFQELEDTVSLEELNLIIKASREAEHRNHKFMAALKGIKMDEDEVDRFEEIKKRAEARALGKTVDELDFEDIGIEVETVKG